ncbi:Putrescine importer PuuP [Actinomadura sp. RB99]|uniref:APC family permease n=1 Tax=Actinomadura sp. RB99 TaxID=2691577 RepID=UPI001684BE80|nr:APC family permease [Actinomadura sp. RB99]MBD2895499.1 Putrescine importer PuuP [Actinomadura sp. RB99]
MTTASPDPAPSGASPGAAARPASPTSPTAGAAAESAEGTLKSFGYDQELKRSLSLADLVIYGLVFMVPIAPFTIFGVVFNGSKGMVALTYVIGLVAMLFTALSYREMSRAFPIAGSVYAYAGRGINDKVGFLAGWAILLDYLLVPTLLYVMSAAALNSLLPAVPQWAWVVVFVLVNTVINFLGIESTARLNRLFLVAELVVLALFVGFGLAAVAQGKNGAHFSFDPLLKPGLLTPGLIFGALSIAVLSFLGFDGISTLSEEVRDSSRRIVGRATVVALCLVAVLFVVQTWVAALLVPGKTEFAGDDATNSAFYDIAQIAGGHWLKVTVAVAAALATGIANSLVAQAATSRLLFSMARDRKLPAFLAHIHPTRKTPERAILFVAVISLILGLFFTGQIDVLSSLVNFGALFSFLLLHVAVFVHFRLRNRSTRWGLHIAAPAIGFLIIGSVLWNADARAKIGGVCWLVLGVLVMLFYRRSGRGTDLKLED